MKLRNWLFEQHVRPSNFARALGKHPEAICRLVREEPGRPSLEFALAIMDATGGAVTLHDLLG